MLDAAEAGGFGISHAKRLRDRAKLEAQLLLTPIDSEVALGQRAGGE